MGARPSHCLLKIKQSLGNPETDTARLLVHIVKQMLVDGQEDRTAIGRRHLEEDILRRSVHPVNGADRLVRHGIYDAITHDLRIRHLIIRIGSLAREIHTTTRQTAGCLFRINALELGKDHIIALETVFLKKERDGKAIDVKDHEIGIQTVEHIIVHLERDLTLHTVRLAQPADAIAAIGLAKPRKRIV